MLDVSWGETFILIGVSITVIGRKDLPRASRFLGTQVGKLVGILQGARARADMFAQNNELQALQNELRSGLRELDTVKGELAIAASSRGLIGRGLGSTLVSSSSSSIATATAANNMSPLVRTAVGNGANRMDSSSIVSAMPAIAAAAGATNATSAAVSMNPIELAPRSQSVAAVAEEEWEKRGIGFKSKAERGIGRSWSSSGNSYNGHSVAISGWKTAGTNGTAIPLSSAGGSALLADFIQQNLIHDQYDRAVMEQDREIQEKLLQKRAAVQKDNQEKS